MRNSQGLDGDVVLIKLFQDDVLVVTGRSLRAFAGGQVHLTAVVESSPLWRMSRDAFADPWGQVPGYSRLSDLFDDINGHISVRPTCSSPIWPESLGFC